MKNHEEILKKCKDSLRTKKLVKSSRKFQKILKILRETFRQILKNFADLKKR